MADAASMPDLSHAEIILRLLLALGLCGLIGIERETRGHVAGMRTHVLVGTGAALFTLVSAYGFAEFYPYLTGRGGGTVMDPTRIAAQIVTGVGFLGAGAIIRQGFTVRGLTTAAALWIVAAVGMAAGAGYYFAAIVTTAGVLLALIGLRKARPAISSALRSDIYYLDLTLSKGPQLHLALGVLARNEISVDSISSEREGDKQDVRLELRVVDRKSLEAAVQELAELDGVDQAVLQSPRGLI